MKSETLITAQRLINLYRQQHVIIGGWKAINPIFLQEANEEVLSLLKELPTGTLLAQHIRNLQKGITKIDSIAYELLPYGGAMEKKVKNSILSNEDFEELKTALLEFSPDEEGLSLIKNLSSVKKLGKHWQQEITNALSDNELLNIWNNVLKTDKAYTLWDNAKEILSQDDNINEINKAKIQAELPEFETYLPLFGEDGLKLLEKLRILVSSL